MPLNKKYLKNAKLYLILDAQVVDHARLLHILKDAVRFGVGIVQLRDKIGTAKDILVFCRHALKITRHKIPFIVNDRIDLALLSGADGIHLGQQDIPYAMARQMMGPKKIIGVSCQNLKHAMDAQRDGADYVGFGSVFKTKTKPERNPMDLKLLRDVLNTIEIPIFPIGGIGCGNIATLSKVGATRAAICRDILLAKNTGSAVKELKQYF